VGFKFTQPRYSDLPRFLRELQSGTIRQAASRAAADAITNLIDERFVDRAAPSGSPWAPRKPPTGSWPILERTGAMRRGFKVMATAAQLTITNSTDYLKYHQTGTANMPARPVLPTGAMPPEWTRRIDSAVHNAIDRHFRK
jgi:hypothetical protein